MRCFAFIIICFLLTSNSGAKWDFNSDNILQGVYRETAPDPYAYHQYNELFFESLSGLRYERKKLTFEGQFLIRSFQSKANEDYLDPAFLELRPPGRLVNKFIYDDLGDTHQNLIDVGTLWASYSLGSLQFTVGRKALGIGVLRSLPVWNRLAVILPSASGYVLNYNPDLIDIRYQQKKWTYSTYSVLAESNERRISAIEATHYGDSVEDHFLAAYWWNRMTFGYASVADVLGATWRLESLYINKYQDKKSAVQVGVGVERAASEKLTLQLEYYHSTLGTRRSAEYLTQSADPFRTLMGQDYVFPQFSYKNTDFLTSQLGSLININDGSLMAVGESNYSFSDSTEIFALVHWPIGPRYGEFGYTPISVDPPINVGYVKFVSMGLKFVF